MLQTRIVRIITRALSELIQHTIYEQLNILKLNDIFELEIAKTMFHYNKKLNVETTKHSQIKTIKQLHDHNTRLSSRNNYFLPCKRTETRQTVTDIYWTKSWQEILAHLKVADISLQVFKKKLQQHLTNHY